MPFLPEWNKHKYTYVYQYVNTHIKAKGVTTRHFTHEHDLDHCLYFSILANANLEVT